MHCVALTTDGGHLAAGDDDGIVWIWNTETGAPVHRLNAHLAPVHDVQWSADGKRLGSVSAVGEVRLWDLATGRQTLSVRAGGGKVTPRLTAHQNRDASAQFGFGSAPGGFFVALYDKVTWFPAP